MNRTIYLCVYRFEDVDNSFIKETEIESVHDLSLGGFWVNEYFEYTKVSDAAYWIPVSKVLCVKKLTEVESI